MTTEKLLEQLNKWILESEQNAEISRNAKMYGLESSFIATAQAYWNVKQLIEVNTEDK